MEVVERSGAERVYTVNSCTADFARHLREKGIRASAIEAIEQLTV